MKKKDALTRIPEATVNQWRAEALHVIRNPQHSTPSQREIAWRFLRQWGLTGEAR